MCPSNLVFPFIACALLVVYLAIKADKRNLVLGLLAGLGVVCFVVSVERFVVAKRVFTGSVNIVVQSDGSVPWFVDPDGDKQRILWPSSAKAGEVVTAYGTRRLFFGYADSDIHYAYKYGGLTVEHMPEAK